MFINRRNVFILNLSHVVYEKLRPEVGEKLLKKGISSLKQLSQNKETKDKSDKKPLKLKKKPIVFKPYPVFHYYPIFRNTFSHHVRERHRHFFV